MSVSEGEIELDPGGSVLHWKAVAKLHPCCVNKFKMFVCEGTCSQNLCVCARVCVCVNNTSSTCYACTCT